MKFAVTAILLLLAICSGNAAGGSMTDSPDAEPEREVVAVFGSGGSGDSLSYISDSAAAEDKNSFPAVVEHSTQLVLCEVTDIREVVYTDTGMFAFQYDVSVLDVFFDESTRLSAGDTVVVSSNEGVYPALEAQALVMAADPDRAMKFGILQGEYDENDVIVSSFLGAIPIEVGGTYLMFLDDSYLENEGLYAESGRSYLYALDGTALYYGRERVKDENDLSSLLMLVNVVRAAELQ